MGGGFEESLSLSKCVGINNGNYRQHVGVKELPAEGTRNSLPECSSSGVDESLS